MRRAQCCALDCTILAATTREAVIWSRLEAPVRRKRALLCALTRSRPLRPFLSLRRSLSSLICFIPSSLRKVGGAHASGTVVSHCSRADQAPLRSALRRWVFSIDAVFFSTPRMPLPAESSACSPDRWRARACTHQGRIYLRVRCPQTVTALSPARTPSWTLPIVSEEEKGKPRVSKMGFYGTLKMIFYKVSRICAGHSRPPSLTRLSRQILPLLRRMRSGVTAPRRRRFNCQCIHVAPPLFDCAALT